MKKIQKRTSTAPITISLLIAIGAILVFLIAYVLPNYPKWQEQSQFESKAKSFIGLTRDQAKNKAKEDGFRYTEASIDGQDQLVDGMYDPNRISVVIENDRVTQAYFDNGAKAQE